MKFKEQNIFNKVLARMSPFRDTNFGKMYSVQWLWPKESLMTHMYCSLNDIITDYGRICRASSRFK